MDEHEEDHDHASLMMDEDHDDDHHHHDDHHHDEHELEHDDEEEEELDIGVEPTRVVGMEVEEAPVIEHDEFWDHEPTKDEIWEVRTACTCTVL